MEGKLTGNSVLWEFESDNKWIQRNRNGKIASLLFFFNWRWLAFHAWEPLKSVSRKYSLKNQHPGSLFQTSLIHNSPFFQKNKRNKFKTSRTLFKIIPNSFPNPWLSLIFWFIFHYKYHFWAGKKGRKGFTWSKQWEFRNVKSSKSQLSSFRVKQVLDSHFNLTTTNQIGFLSKNQNGLLEIR